MNKYKLAYWLSIVAWMLALLWAVSTTTNGADLPQEVVEESVFDIPAQEPQTYEDWFRENSTKIDSCTITHYCCERYKHICGTGSGITATGTEVIADYTCAVDPTVIPYGAEVMVDYGDSVAFYVALDCGGSVNGNHIDLAVETHTEALELGTKEATVYWRIYEPYR